MILLIKKLLAWLKGSADNDPGGASSKKLTTFWVVTVLITPVVFAWLIWAYRHDNWEHLTYVLDALLLFALSCLGINAWEKKQGVAQIKPDA